MARRPSGAGHRDRRRRLDAGLPGHGHRHGQADAGRPGRGAAPLPRPRRSRPTTSPSPSSGAAYDEALDRIDAPRCPGAARGRHRAVPAAPSSTDSIRPAGGRTSRADARGRAADTSALHGRLADLDPVAAAKIEPTNRRRVVRALEVTLGSGRPFSSFGPGVDAYPPTDVVQIGLRWPRPALADAHRSSGCTAMIDAGLLDEVGRLRAGGLSRDRRARRSATRSCSTTSTVRASLDAAVDHDRRCAPASSPCARSGGSVVTPAYAGSTSTTTRSPSRRRSWSEHSRMARPRR